MVSRRHFLITAAAAAPAFAADAQKKAAPTGLAPAAAPKDDSQLPAPILGLKDRKSDLVPITKEERGTRHDLARELMKQYGMNAILITTGSSLTYFTGARWGQSERLFCYVIPQAAAPFIVCPYLERDHLGDAIMSFPERETTITYLWHEDEDPYVILRRALGEVGIATGTLGIEEHVQYAFANSIAQACPAIKMIAVTPVTAGCRSLKSPAEIALLRLANNITFDVYKAVYLSCGPGDTNQRFSDLVAQAYIRSGVRGNASCNVGEFSAVPHGSGKPQVIREGDMVMIDDGCTCDGYTSDMTRSFVYGKPSELQRQVFEIVHNAQSAALAAAHPGVAMQDVDAAARKVIVEAGYGPGYDYFNHRVGHGIGLDMHEWPYLVGGNKQKLVASMVFSDEPGVYIRGKFGVRLEDDMVITDSGAELFTPQSPSLQDPFAIPDAAKAPETFAATPQTGAPTTNSTAPPRQ